MIRGFRAGRGHDQRSWPPLLLVVIVPTICVLWFMLAAMDNERVAVRQRLITGYRAQLSGVKSQLAVWLQQEAAALDSRVASESCAAVFASVVREGQADSLICHGTEEAEEYPCERGVHHEAAELHAEGWDHAALLERKREFQQAAQAFARIAQGSSDDQLVGRALQAQARCLNKAGRRDAALRVLGEQLAQPRFRFVLDRQGRMIAPNAQLLALQLIEDPDDETFRLGAAALREMLTDYGKPVMPAPQRRFLMRELQRLLPEGPAFDTLRAEDLAAGFLASKTAPAAPSALTRSGPGDLWQLVSPSGRVVTLHDEVMLRERLRAAIAGMDLPAEILQPGIEPDPASLFVSFNAEEALPGWRLALQIDEQALADEATRHQQAVYLWTGLLVIALIIAATSLVARAIGRQMRSTRLKNNLLATVSHELKTPLASMRLLVDTLLDRRPLETQRVREYLELISKENNRLSRLVENFLSFSRMERNKQKFEREEIAAETVVRTAASAVGERFNAPGCRFEVEIAPGLPSIYADPDALVTVILNLLDNAYKYSGDDKRIALRAYSDNGGVCFAVRDNGIGLPGRVRHKIFERFYQVDQSLAREGSGCGLGLSIVRFIVGAHDGSVDVDSRLGEGSTFTVKLPAMEHGQRVEAGPRAQEALGAR